MFRFTSRWLDRSFLTKLSRRGDQSLINDAIISMASAMGVPVIVKSVEIPVHFDFISTRGYGYVQSLLVGWPMQAHDPVAAVLSDWRRKDMVRADRLTGSSAVRNRIIVSVVVRRHQRADEELRSRQVPQEVVLCTKKYPMTVAMHGGSASCFPARA